MQMAGLLHVSKMGPLVSSSELWLAVRVQLPQKEHPFHSRHRKLRDHHCRHSIFREWFEFLQRPNLVWMTETEVSVVLQSRLDIPHKGKLSCYRNLG